MQSLFIWGWQFSIMPGIGDPVVSISVVVVTVHEYEFS